jgi:hypothetical protein
MSGSPRPQCLTRLVLLEPRGLAPTGTGRTRKLDGSSAGTLITSATASRAAERPSALAAESGGVGLQPETLEVAPTRGPRRARVAVVCFARFAVDRLISVQSGGGLELSDGAARPRIRSAASWPRGRHAVRFP